MFMYVCNAQTSNNWLISYLSFNKTLKDSVGVATAASHNASFAIDRNNKPNNAIDLTASNSYVDIIIDSLVTGAGARTMSIWFKTNQTPSSFATLAAYGSASAGRPIYPLFINNAGKLYFESGSSQDIITSTNPVNDNNWHLATVVYNGTTVNLFLDSTLQGTANANLQTVSSLLQLGKCVWSGGNNFNGYLDDFRYYNRALSLVEVKQIFENIAPRNNLQAYYAFSNNLSDSSNYKRCAINNGCVFVNDYTAKPNNALLFKNASYVSFKTRNIPLANSSRSITLWFKTDVTPSGFSTLAAYGSAAAGKPIFPLFINSSGKLYFESGSSQNYISSTNSVCDNNWHFAAVTYNGIYVSLYLDGVLQDTSHANLQTALSNLEIGRCVWTGGHFFKGIIDEVKVYNNELSASEILSLFQSVPIQNINLNEGLIAHYALDTCGLDSSGNGFNISTSSWSNTTDRYGIINKAVEFNGTNNHFVIPDTVTKNLNTFTLSCWIKTKESKFSGIYWQAPHIIGNATPNSGSGEFGITTNNGYLGIWSGLINGDNYKTSNYRINDNKWHFITMTYNGSKLNLFLDGKETNCNIEGFKSLNTANFYMMASNYNGPNYYHQGILDDVKFYNRKLSNDEISLLYNNKCIASVPIVSNQNVWNLSNVTFNATNGNTFKWYDKQFEGNLLHTGASFSKVISNNDTLFVSNYAGCETTPVKVIAYYNDLSRGLNAHYAFDNYTAYDSSAYQNIGVVYGTQSASDINGKGALLFNGTSDYVKIPSVVTSNLNKFTISFRIKTKEKKSNGSYWQKPCIVGNSKNASSDGDFGVVTNDGYIGLWTGLDTLGDNNEFSNFQLSDSAWHYVVCTYDGNILTLKVDNIDNLITLRANKLTNNFGYWLMAQHKYTDEADFFHQGVLDDVRFYNRNLNPQELEMIQYGNLSNGIEQIKEKYNFISIYPNPAKNYVYIENKNDGSTNISIINSLGVIVKQLEIPAKSSEIINITEFSSGIYYLQSNSNKNLHVEKLIIK